MKIINDPEIDELFLKNKDYKIKSSVSDVYEKLSMKQTAEIFTKPIKTPKKPLIIGSLLGSLTGLVVAGVSIFVVYNTQMNQVTRTNISSEASFLEDKERSQVLGKELLLFSMTKSNDSLGMKSRALENLKLEKNNSLLSNNMYGHIIAGFENIAPIIFNQISSFDKITNNVFQLNNPTTIGKVSFNNKYISSYNSLDFSYYYNDDGSTDYGITSIGPEYYKTYIYEVKKAKKAKTEIYLEGIDNSTLFKIAEEEGTNSFVYKEFENNKDVKDDKYSFYYDVELGNGKEASNFALKSYKRYEINYNNILLKNILEILFNVNYTDVESNLKYNFDNCLCADKNIDGTEYLIGENKIIL